MEQPPTAPFTLHWVWSDNEWSLASRDPNGSTFTVFQAWNRDRDVANMILGPEAGVIQPPPIDKPVYLTRIDSLAAAEREHSRALDRQRQTEIPQAPAGGEQK